MRLRCFAVLRIHSLYFVLYFYWIHHIVMHFFSNLFCLEISFSNFSDILPTCTCASAVGNLWSISLGLNIFRLIAKFEASPFSFCCLLNFRISSTTSTTLSWFSFSGISVLLTALLKSIDALLTRFTIFSFILLLELYKSLNKNDGFWYLKCSTNILVFIFTLSCATF